MGMSVVVVEPNPQLAQSLAGGLASHFHSVQLTRSSEEMRERIANHKPQAVILDLESSGLSDVQNLRHDFPWLPIVCTHRVPDEELWIAALEAGADDMCAADDVQHVLNSVLRNVSLLNSAAA
jgi:DNA-binding response OmpR family regulator